MPSISKTFLDFKYRTYKERQREPLKYQGEILQEICQQLTFTKYASDLGLIGDISPQEYKACMPLSRYADIAEHIYEMKGGTRDVLQKDKIRYYGESSGTTGRSKTIPLSKKYVRDGIIKGSVYSAAIINHYYREATDGHTIILPGSLRQQSDYFVGDVSAVMADHIPFLLKGRSALRTDLEHKGSWEQKLEAIWQHAISSRITGMTGLPTWNLKMLEHFARTKHPEDFHNFVKDISFFIHGGINIAPYRERIRQITGNDDLIFINVYNATEGFFACQDDPDDDSMSLVIDAGVYYEFVEVSDIDSATPQFKSLAEVETGKNYVLVISNTSGLYRYVMEDIITFTKVHPFKIKIQGRTSGFLNAFGEEVMEENCHQVVMKLNQELDQSITEFTVAPVHQYQQTDGHLGHHLWLLECNTDQPANTEMMSHKIDALLHELNHDYAEKRKHNYVMTRPEVRLVPHGTFHRYLTNRSKVSVQSKVARISQTTALIEQIIKHKTAIKA